MAGFLTTYGANALLSGVAMPTTFYAKGHIGAPDSDGLGFAAAETRRVLVTLDTPALGIVTNDNTTGVFSASTEETWTHVTLWDASSSGNAWWVLPLTTALDILVGNTIRVDASTISLTLSRWGA